MEFRLDKKQEYILLSFIGKWIGETSSKELDSAIQEMGELDNPILIVNLSKLELLDSNGISYLIRLLTLARNAGGELYLINVPAQIGKLLIMTKLKSIFSIYPNLEAALAAEPILS